jgi:hypothetical protein
MLNDGIAENNEINEEQLLDISDSCPASPPRYE